MLHPIKPKSLYIDVMRRGLSDCALSWADHMDIQDLTIYLRASLFFVTLGVRKNRA
jgi:hypothetical protein